MGGIGIIILAIKIIVISSFVFICDVLAYEADYDDSYISITQEPIIAHFVDGYCEKTIEHTHERIIEYTDINGMIKTTKYISYHKDQHALNYADDYERIIMIHDKKNNLLFSKHYTWIDKKLVQTIDDGVARNIISGKTHCDFTIIEPSGDSISYHLDPKKKINGPIKNNDAFSSFIHGHNILFKDYEKKYNAHDAIMYQWHSYCKKYHEKQEAVEPSGDSVSFHSDTEKELDISIKDELLSYMLSYKYYAIIILIITGIIILIVVIKSRIRKGRIP